MTITPGHAKQPVIDIRMILTPEDAIAACLESLPPLEKAVLRGHFLDGLSVLRLSQQLGIRQTDVRSTMESALTRMRTILGWRGVRGIGDVI